MLLTTGGAVLGSQHVHTFDGAETALRLEYDKSRLRLRDHRRHRYEVHGGRASETARFDVGSGGGRVSMEYTLPPARVIDDLELAVWIRSNRPGATVALRVILPNQRDPATGGVLSTFVVGGTYSETGDWQKLVCRTPERAIAERLRLLRWKLRDETIDARNAYVDRMVVRADLDAGPVEFFVDDLAFGPIVDPRKSNVRNVSASEESTSPVDFRLDQLYVEGRPFLPVFVPYHGESPEELADAGFNTVLVPRFDDAELLGSLRRNGLWGMATPPRPTAADGSVLGASTARLLPFGPESDDVLLWLGGSRVGPERRADVASWVSQIRQADSRGRPVFVDVTGDEREFSRVVRTLGITRHVLHGSLPMRSHHEWLLDRRNEAWPGTFLWTWIQTEPFPTLASSRRASDRLPIVVEPEQIRLQVYGALAAGCRGIGYWSRTPLNENAPGATERRLAIRQLNLELGLLEPLLATSGRAGTVTFDVRHDEEAIGRRHIDFQAAGRGRRQRNALLKLWETKRDQHRDAERAWEAAVLRTSAGTLILPVWYGHGAQYVPGRMAANDARILLAGASETATAWEITTTGIRSLGRGEPRPGGRMITLPKFDQTAAILVTTDRRAIDGLRRRIAEVAEASSRTTIDLAAAKLSRVEETSRLLRELGVAQPDAPQLLGGARALLQRAESVHERGDFDAARQFAMDSMQLARILQRADWDDATHGLVSPVTSPHTLCHSTLPDHWRMVAAIGRSPFSAERDLLRSGDFEDLETMRVEGWWHGQGDVPGTRAKAELAPEAREGRYALRLVAVADRRRTGDDGDEPEVPDRSTVTIRTPPLAVRAGQLVHVGGWYRHVPEGEPHPDGPVVYDDLLGPTAALRLARCRGEESGGWRRFELIREAHRSGEMSVTFALNGHGELHLDDVRVIPLDPRSPPPDRPRTRALPAYGNPLELLDRLPSIPGFRGE